MTIRRLAAACCLIALATPLSAVAPAAADETTRAIREAEKHYRQGDLGTAYTKLEDAAAGIARVLSARYARTFPGAPAGWRADPVQSSAKTKVQLGRGMQLSRNYFPLSGTGVAHAKILVDDRGVMAALVENIRKREAGKIGGAVAVPIPGGGTAYLRHQQRYRNASIALLIGRRFYITVSANRMDRPDLIVQQILKSWDFAALRRAGGLK